MCTSSFASFLSSSHLRRFSLLPLPFSTAAGVRADSARTSASPASSAAFATALVGRTPVGHAEETSKSAARAERGRVRAKK